MGRRLSAVELNGLGLRFGGCVPALDTSELVCIVSCMDDLAKWAELARCGYSAETFLRDAVASAVTDWQRDQLGKALDALMDVTHDAFEHVALRLRDVS